jgi:hypothetical protein
MNKQLTIVGAGLVGLLAAYHFSKKNFKVTIIDKKDKASNDHHAILRMKTDIRTFCPELKGIEQATIHKNVLFDNKLHSECNILMNNFYSLKTTGTLKDRSIWNLEAGTRFIPPVDFYDQLLELCCNQGVDIILNTPMTREHITKDTIITAPLPAVLKSLGVPLNANEFKSEAIMVYENIIDSNLESNIHQTLYIPEPNKAPYRISIVQNRVIAELPRKEEKEEYNSMTQRLDSHMLAFGIQSYDMSKWVAKTQPLGKLVPINEDTRKGYIYNITKSTGTFLLGRFATWRQIMLDDVLKDIIKIEQLMKMESDSNYDNFKKLGGNL